MRPPDRAEMAIFTGVIDACHRKASMVGREILLDALAHHVYASYADKLGTYVNPASPAITKPRPWPSKVFE